MTECDVVRLEEVVWEDVDEDDVEDLEEVVVVGEDEVRELVRLDVVSTLLLVDAEEEDERVRSLDEDVGVKEGVVLVVVGRLDGRDWVGVVCCDLEVDGVFEGDVDGVFEGDVEGVFEGVVDGVAEAMDTVIDVEPLWYTLCGEGVKVSRTEATELNSSTAEERIWSCDEKAASGVGSCGAADFATTTASMKLPSLMSVEASDDTVSDETSVAIGIDGEAGEGDCEASEGRMNKLDCLVYVRASC